MTTKSSLVTFPAEEKRICEITAYRSRVGEVQINGTTAVEIQTYAAKYPSGKVERRVLVRGEAIFDMSKTETETLICLLKQALES